MLNDVTIRRMKAADFDGVLEVYRLAFPRAGGSAEWIRCNMAAYPRMQYFVAVRNGKVVGYILWIEHGGFRKQAVIELEQIAVHPDYQGQGVGERIIRQSLPEVEKTILERGSAVKNILVTTRTDNYAQRLYAKALGAKPEAVIKDLFSADEVYMVARRTAQPGS